MPKPADKTEKRKKIAIPIDPIEFVLVSWILYHVCRFLKRLFYD